MKFPTELLTGMTGFFGQFGQRRRQLRDRKYYENLTKEMQERTFGNNKALMEMQQKFDRGMFDYSNAYNTPAAQMRRLKQAGLNPALMYGQGTTGNTNASMPTADTIPTTFSGAEIAQSAAAGAQMSVMNSQVQLNKANAIAKGIDSAVNAGQYGIAKQLSQFQMQNLAKDIEVKNQNISESIARIKNVSADTRLKAQQKLTLMSQEDLNKATALFTKQKTDKGVTGSTIFDTLSAVGLDPVNNDTDRVIVQGIIGAQLGLASLEKLTSILGSKVAKLVWDKFFPKGSIGF
jgi:ribosomal protein L25 (general stress protein Ctc)